MTDRTKPQSTTPHHPASRAKIITFPQPSCYTKLTSWRYTAIHCSNPSRMRPKVYTTARELFNNIRVNILWAKHKANSKCLDFYSGVLRPTRNCVYSLGADELVKRSRQEGPFPSFSPWIWPAVGGKQKLGFALGCVRNCNIISLTSLLSYFCLVCWNRFKDAFAFGKKDGDFPEGNLELRSPGWRFRYRARGKWD